MSKLKLQHVFKISHEDVDGSQLDGTFTCKKLSILDTSKVGVLVAQLNGGMYHDDDKPGHGVDAYTNAINNMIAHLKLALVSQPDWFDLDSVYDLDLLTKVHKEVRTFENSFRRDAEPRDDARSTSQSRSVPAEESSERPRKVGKVVAHEVQAALEP